MLAAIHCLRRREDFSRCVRRGRRAGTGSLVVYLCLGDQRGVPAGPTRAGFVVSAAVGGSVVRHRVVRRLRGLVAARLASLPAESTLVVRALPPAASATSGQLGHDLDRAVRQLLDASVGVR